jgi:hypothetical protein
MKMSQEQLTEFFVGMGASVDSDMLAKHNSMISRTVNLTGTESWLMKGISMHVKWPNKLILSVQAGGSNYSSPREYVPEYDAVEIAIWREGGPMINLYDVWNEFSKSANLNYIIRKQHIQVALDNYADVGGYIDWPNLEAIAKILSSLDSPAPNTNANLKRSTGPWKIT